MDLTRFYRIASAKFCADLSGKGAEILGGRFNPVGTAALYVATSISLATLEMLVHTEDVFALNHYIMAVDIPNVSMAKVKRYTAVDLPDSWNSLDSLVVAQQFGHNVLFNAGGFGLLVPSVVTPEESNLVLNPHHAEMAGVRISELRKLALDDRLK